jgi:hypothetical protein
MRISFCRVELHEFHSTLDSHVVVVGGVYVCVCAPWSSCFWVRGIVDDDPWGGILCSWWGVGSVGRGRTGSTCRRSTPFAAAAAAA